MSEATTWKDLMVCTQCQGRAPCGQEVPQRESKNRDGRMRRYSLGGSIGDSNLWLAWTRSYSRARREQRM